MSSKELRKLIRRLELGDVVLVCRFDRLARSTRDLLNLLHDISQRGASFGSLADPWCDITSPIGELIVTVLAGIASFERHLIRSRCKEDAECAKDRGVRFGRPRKLTPHQRQEALARLDAGETQADIARTFNVAHTTIGRLAR
jgi:DNA invertase Pin-like site-specific DNA recombinase